MPVNPTYPGVYLQELPSGARTIAGLPTSITAFVGCFVRGPANVPVRVFNPGDFERNFGGLDRQRETTYGVTQFFQNGGGQALIVRVAPGGVAASVEMLDDAAGVALVATAGQQIGEASADNPGLWGNNLRLDVDYAAADPATQFNLTVTEIREDAGRALVVRSETFRNLSMDETLTSHAPPVVNDGSVLIQLTQGASTDRPAVTGTLAGAGADPSAATAGDSAIDMTVTIGGAAVTETLEIAGADMPASLPDARALLESLIRAARPTEPMWAQAAVQLMDGRLRVLLGRNGTDYDPEAVVSFADDTGDLAANLGLAGGAVTENVQQYRLGSPNAALAFRGAAVAGVDDTGATAAALAGSRAARSGVFALETADLFNILCIPEASLLDGPGQVTNLNQVMSAAIPYCEERFAFLLIDPAPDVDTPDDAAGWLDDIATAGMRHRNAAAYFPRLRIADPLNDNRLRSIGPSGAMAGLYARTDGDFGVFRAPAGIIANLRGVQGVDYRMTDPENGLLNPLGLNAIRIFDNIGTVSWGARTLVGADMLSPDWRYVPVRRTALNIEASLMRGLQFAVFAPNDEPLWAEIRLAANAFMSRLFRQGAFQGASPRDAFFVKCDAETNPQSDIDLGIVNVLVGFAPLKPAEFVVLSLQLMNLQAAS